MLNVPLYDRLTWNSAAFVEKFVNDVKVRPDLRYAFVLGAGASVQSEIQPAGVLARKWLEQLFLRHGSEDQKIEDWATSERLGIPGLVWGRLDESYSKIYDRLFQDNPADGFAFLEQEMEGKTPSIGYSVLAEILATTQHNVVITTNFDNLVADAMAIYTQKFPLVCGHEALAEFAQPAHRRPIVAKIHRDLVLNPHSSVRKTARLSDTWSIALEHLFRHYTPIFIGYGGNDGSLMGYLEALEPGTLASPPFWCYYSEGPEPNERIREFLRVHSGVLVPIAGFDELMIALAHELSYKLDKDELLNQVALDRAKAYRNQAERLDPKQWTSWAMRAEQMKDIEDKIKVFRDGLKVLPDSSNLLATFLNLIRNTERLDDMEDLSKKLLKLQPDRVSALVNLSYALIGQKKLDEVEPVLARLLELEPNHPKGVYNSACVAALIGKRKESLDLLKRAIELLPSYVTKAPTDQDLASLWKDPTFLEMTRPPDDVPAANGSKAGAEHRNGKSKSQPRLAKKLKKPPSKSSKN